MTIDELRREVLDLDLPNRARMSRALRELAEAAASYDGEECGLGSAFIGEVERASQQILRFPEVCPLALGPVRTKLISALRIR